MDPPPPQPPNHPARPDDWLEVTFNAALNLPTADREAYLIEACAGDANRLRDIRALLKAHEEAGDFLKTEASPPEVKAERARLKPEQAGEHIGPYKLLQQIGEGGFGTVWMAEQEQPVRRRVALKIIKLGMDTKQIVARFEQERQALAMMDHPNIAKVFDAGATPTGRPYFVMELVRGIKITDYCDQASLPTAERLQLFIAVCHAVQHAHQKGIIHRDLKPSNILVTLHDGTPVPKVIDFGVAKATQQRLTDLTVFTQFEQMIGTPLYMSPEQAEMSGLDIDTRSDIYSLGVLLYELLAGRTPFDPKELLKRGLDEIRRAIREQEPPRPSTALGTMALDARTNIALRRQSDSARLIGLLRGDLDWIVMKALEKDRTRRYDTANAFAEDIQRHLGSEPVVASPPGNLYRFRKLVQRNRLAFAASAAVTVALIGGVAVSVWQAARADREAQRAHTAERLATDRAEEVKREAATSKAISEFLQTEFLAEASPTKEPDRDVKLRTVIDRAAKKIDGRFPGQPLVEAAIRETIGESYDELGEFPAAQVQLDAAMKLRRATLGDEHPDTLITLRRIGDLAMHQGRQADAEALLTQALEKSRRTLGAENQATLLAMNSLAELFRVEGRYGEANSLLAQALEISRRVLGAEHQDTLHVLSRMAQVLREQERFTEAEPLTVEALEISRRTLGAEHPETIEAMQMLGLLYIRQGRNTEAEPIFVSTLEISRRVLGPEHPVTLENEGFLGNINVNLARYTEAERYLVPLPDKTARVYGAENVETAFEIQSLAWLYHTEGRYTDAGPLFTKSLEYIRKGLGEHHPFTLHAMNLLAVNDIAQGRYADAEPLLLRALQTARSTPDEPRWLTLMCRLNLARTYQLTGRYAEAESLLLENLKILRQPDQVARQLSRSLGQLTEALLAEDKPLEAELVAREGIAVCEQEKPGGWPALQARALLGAVLLAQKKYAEAEPLLVAGAEGLEQREAKIPAPDKSCLVDAINSLVQFYEVTQQSDKAAAWRAKLDARKAPPAKP